MSLVTPRQVSHMYTQTLAGAPDEILPLLTRWVRRRGARAGVTEIDIRVAATGPGRSEAVVRYTYTGFTARGNALVEARTPEHSRRFMLEWEEQLNAYLVRTRPSSPPAR